MKALALTHFVPPAAGRAALLAFLEAHAVRANLLINNAGIGGRSAKLKEVKGSDLLEIIEVHCVSVLRLSQCLVDNLLLTPHPAIININSRMGSISEQYKGTFSHLKMNYEYRIAKAAQNMLSACIKGEYQDRLKVYQVHPGRMKTNLSQSDADLDPADAAKNIFDLWSRNQLTEGQGIIDSQENKMIAW